MSEKISGRVLSRHVDIFHSLCILHAALHLGGSGEKLDVPRLQRERNNGNVCWVISGDFFHWDYFQREILLTRRLHSAYWKQGRRNALHSGTLPSSAGLGTQESILDF